MTWLTPSQSNSIRSAAGCCWTAPPSPALSVGRNVHRLDEAPLAEVPGLAPGEKEMHRVEVRLAGVVVADLSGEEFPKAVLSLRRAG